ncbi:MAG: hypothetical protein ACJ76H_11780 [Bacteriovoracaceae bacterium]
MKTLNPNPEEAQRIIRELENMAGLPAYDLQGREDIKVQIRVNEAIGPAMFRADPLLPGGYMANSLTIRAMKPDIFVLHEDLEDFSHEYECGCGKIFDLQFWKLCPYCARDIKV